MLKFSCSPIHIEQKGLLVGFLFVYNVVMDFVASFVEIFESTMTGLIPLIVPVVGVLIVFKILADLLYRD